MTADDLSENGLVTLSSRYSAEETLARLERTLASRGLKVFAVIDHSGEARQTGLVMPDTKLIIFGNPKGGTPLMIAAPSLAIDLPMKILIREDSPTNVLVSYTKAEFLGARHGLGSLLIAPLAVVSAIATEIAQ